VKTKRKGEKLGGGAEFWEKGQEGRRAKS